MFLLTCYFSINFFLHSSLCKWKPYLLLPNPGSIFKSSSLGPSNIPIISNWSLITGMHSSGMRVVRCSSRLPEGCLSVRVSALGVSACRGCLPARGITHYTYPLPPCGQTDTCEKITFPQLMLQTVIMTIYSSQPLSWTS